MKPKLHFFSLATSIESLVALAFLLIIPPDPKNAWLFGYSSPRLGLALVILLIGIASFWITINLRTSDYVESRLISLYEKIYADDFWLFSVFAILLAIATFGIVYIPFWIFISDGQAYEASLTRLAPLVLLLSAISLQLLWLIKSRLVMTAIHKHRIWLFLPLVILISASYSIVLVRELTSQLESGGRQQFIAKDSAHYYEIAESFSHLDFRMEYVREQRAHRQPLYPFLLAIPLKLFDGDIYPLALVNVGLVILFLHAAYFSIYKLMHSAIAAFAAVLFIVFDRFLFRNIITQLMTEPLFLLLSFTTNVLFLLYIERQRAKYLYLAAIFSGLAYLARPNGLFLILTLSFVLLGYEISIFFREKTAPIPLLQALIRRYSIFIGIIVLTTIPSWLPRVYYIGNPIYHDYLPNYLWVDTYEQGHIQGPPRYSMHDYFANHTLADVISRFEFGLHKVFYADTIVRQRWPVSLFVVLGLVFGCLSPKRQYWLLTLFMFLQMLPIVWTYLPNDTTRIPYVSLLPFALIYFALFFSISTGVLLRIGAALRNRFGGAFGDGRGADQAVRCAAGAPWPAD